MHKIIPLHEQFTCNSHHATATPVSVSRPLKTVLKLPRPSSMSNFKNRESGDSPIAFPSSSTSAMPLSAWPSVPSLEPITVWTDPGAPPSTVSLVCSWLPFIGELPVFRDASVAVIGSLGDTKCNARNDVVEKSEKCVAQRPHATLVWHHLNWSINYNF